MRSRIQVAEDIVPLGEFKTQASRLIRQINDNNRSIVVTQNGRPALVVLSPSEFDRLNEQIRFLKSVNKGLADAEKGDAITDDQMTELLDASFGQISEND